MSIGIIVDIDDDDDDDDDRDEGLAMLFCLHSDSIGAALQTRLQRRFWSGAALDCHCDSVSRRMICRKDLRSTL